MWVVDGLNPGQVIPDFKKMVCAAFLLDDLHLKGLSKEKNTIG